MRSIVDFRGRYPIIVGATLNMLHLIFRVDWHVIPHYHPPPLSFFDMRKFSLYGPLNGLYRYVEEGKELMHVIATIDAKNQMVTGLKVINYRLNSDTPKKHIGGG
jgi:hypothetical protein